MIRKLLVAVFALSFAALGCGSDDGDKKNPGVDAGRDSTPATETAAPAVEAGPKDIATSPDQALDVAVGPEVKTGEVGGEAGKTTEAGSVQLEVQSEAQAPAPEPAAVDGGAVDADESID